MESSDQAEERSGAQLRELNSMVRGQESSLSTALALFMLTNAVLVFSFFQQEDHYLARSAISLVGIAVNGVLLLVAMQARENLETCGGKALTSESDLGIPQELRIWTEATGGMPNWKTAQLSAAALLAFWGVGVAFALMNLLM